MAKQNSKKAADQRKYFLQWVLFVSFIFTVIAAVITGSYRISLGAFFLGTFLCYLLYMGYWYNP